MTVRLQATGLCKRYKARLVVKEYVRLVGAQERTLVLATQEQGLVDLDVPGPQGPHHSFVGWGGTRGY